MATPPDRTLRAWLDERLPPSEAGFSSLVDAYLASANRARILRELTRLRKEVDVPAPFGGGLDTQPRTFEKLAETLLLFEEALDPAAGRATAVRRAYQHYIVNTDGPIPMQAGAADFDVFAWLTEYAAGLDIALQRIENADEGAATLMIIDDPERPVRCAAWGNVEGQSSAWSLREAGRLVNFRRYGRNDIISSRLFAPEPGAHSHSHANALWLAELSQLVYLREGYVRAQLGSLGYAPVRWIQHPGTDTQAVAASREDHAVLVFRGTAGVRDMLTDLAFRKQPFRAGPDGAPPVGRAHRGFVAALDGVWSDVLQAVQALGPGRPIFIAGHSLGAALAQLTALRLVAHGQAVAGVYTYGSPRVGDTEFRSAYDAALGERTFMHVNDEDVVPTIPPGWTGFDHVAQPARRFDKTHKLALDEDGASSREAAPLGDEAEAVERELMERAAAAMSESQRYLTTDELRSPDSGGMTYGAEFAEGRLDDHGIAQYLFKFACAIVDERIAARGLGAKSG
jgi:thioesterase domain-containing protein